MAKENKKISFGFRAAFLLLTLASMSCFLGLPGKPQPLKIEPDSMPNAALGVPYSARMQVSENGTPVANITLIEGTLPPGLELKIIPGKNSAAISGVPTTAGAYSFTVHVWCYSTNNHTGQSQDVKYSIVVE